QGIQLLRFRVDIYWKVPDSHVFGIADLQSSLYDLLVCIGRRIPGGNTEVALGPGIHYIGDLQGKRAGMDREIFQPFDFKNREVCNPTAVMDIPEPDLLDHLSRNRIPDGTAEAFNFRQVILR